MFSKGLFFGGMVQPTFQRHRKVQYLSTFSTAALIVFGVPAGLYTYKCLMLIAFQNQLIYMGYLPPGSRHSEDFRQNIPSSLNVREEIITTCDKKRLHGFIVSRKSAQVSSATEGSSKTGAVMIYFQGNAGNISDRFELFNVAIKAIPDLTIIGIAYRQYGNSEGYATETGLKKDAKAIIKAVQTIYGPETSLYLYGHSLGGAVAIDLATISKANTIQGIIIENTFTSIYDMVCTLYPKFSPYPFIAKYCLWNHWESHTQILRLPPTIPLLFLSSERDEMVPPLQMKQLYTLARRNHIHNATFVKFNRSLHMNIYSTEPHQFQSALKNFIVKHAK